MLLEILTPEKKLFSGDVQGVQLPGIDGLFVEIEGESLTGVVQPLPQNPTPPELQLYYSSVVQDKDKGLINFLFHTSQISPLLSWIMYLLNGLLKSEWCRLNTFE